MPAKEFEPHKSSIGSMEANIMALLCYIVPAVAALIPGIGFIAWLAPLVIFFVEKQSEFVKFAGMQSFVLQLVGAVLGIVVTIIGGVVGVAAYAGPAGAVAAVGILGVIGAVSFIITLVILVFAIIAIVNAYKYKQYRIPFLSKVADKLAELLSGKSAA